MEHEDCPGRGMIDFTLKKIKEKTNSMIGLKEKIEKAFDQIIDQISDFRDQILNEVETKTKAILLSSV